MATGNKPVDCHGSEIIDEDALLDVASSSKKGNVPDQISLPMKDFTDMKEQNLRILALLGDLFDGNEKFKKVEKEPNDHGSWRKVRMNQKWSHFWAKIKVMLFTAPPPPPQKKEEMY